MGSTYENVNPLTDSMMNGWGAGGDMNFYDYTRSAMASSGVMDPTSVFTQFQQGAGGLMKLGLDATNPYVQAIDAYTNSIMGDTTRAALTPYSGDNSFYSSGAVEASTRAAGQVNLQAQAQKLGAQTTMVGNLLSGGMSMLTAARGQTAGLLGQMISTGGEMATPVMQEKQDPLVQGLSLGINALGAVGGILAAPMTGGTSLLATILASGNKEQTVSGGTQGTARTGGSGNYLFQGSTSSLLEDGRRAFVSPLNRNQ